MRSPQRSRFGRQTLRADRKGIDVSIDDPAGTVKPKLNGHNGIALEHVGVKAWRIGKPAGGPGGTDDFLNPADFDANFDTEASTHEFEPTPNEIRNAAKQIILRRAAERLVNEIEAERLLALSSVQAYTGVAFLKDVQAGDPVWGKGNQVPWARNQGFMIFGTDGTGKSTILQQIVLARLGVRDPDVLGFPVAQDDRSILYLALDRPAQIRESIERMVDLSDPTVYDCLDRRLTVIRGPVPFQCDENPRAFVDWCLKLAGDDCGLVVVDSVKDMVSNCNDPVAGSGFNDTMQLFIGKGIDFGCAHHNRKENAQNTKPRNLADVYGSRFLTAGMGAVVNIWKTDDANRELTQLKSPYGNPFGPIEYADDYASGTSQVSADWRGLLVSVLHNAGRQGLTDAEVVFAVFDQTAKDAGYESNRIKITRQIKTWINQGQTAYERTEGRREGKPCKIWRLKSGDYDDVDVAQLDAQRKKHKALEHLADIDSKIAALECGSQ